MKHAEIWWKYQTSTNTFINLYAMEPWYNKGLRDWQNLFAITRSHEIKVLFHIFYYYWSKKISFVMHGSSWPVTIPPRQPPGHVQHFGTEGGELFDFAMLCVISRSVLRTATQGKSTKPGSDRIGSDCESDRTRFQKTHVAILKRQKMNPIGQYSGHYCLFSHEMSISGFRWVYHLNMKSV